MAHRRGKTQNPDHWVNGKNRPGASWLVFLLAGMLVGLGGCGSQGALHGSFPEQVRPSSNTARLLKNAAYLKQTKRVELALKELEEAHLREPENLVVTDALIQCYEELGSFTRAQELYKEALVLVGDHQNLENNRCYSLYLAGRLNEAETGFRELLAYQPGNQTSRNNLGLVLCRQGRETEALAVWREALGEDTARQRLRQALTALGREVVPPSLSSRPVVAGAYSGTNPGAQGTNLDNRSALKPDFTRPSVSYSQPPADTAAAAVASGHLARRAPHPSADTASGSVSSPRKPALKTVPPGQMPAREAMPLQPAPPPAAAPSSPPVVDSMFRRAASVPGRAWLTAEELITTRIVIRNGNGKKNLARETRSLLWGEGFNVVAISNHVDFGREKTVITHRPEAIRVAEVVAERFFPNADLQSGDRLPATEDVRVTLGKTLLQRKDFLALLAY